MVEMRILVDASAVMSVLLNEPAKGNLIARSQGASLVAPGSLRWEIGNALSSWLKRDRITEKEAAAILDEYARIPIQSVEVDLKAALSLSAKHSVYAYDAYVLLAAKQYRLPLMTLDASMIEIAKKEKIKTLEV